VGEEQDSHTLGSHVLHDACLVIGAGITMVGQCEECGKPTQSAMLKFCAACASKKGVCQKCGLPLDREPEPPESTD
jgi:hypothetical protein